MLWEIAEFRANYSHGFLAGHFPVLRYGSKAANHGNVCHFPLKLSFWPPSNDGKFIQFETTCVILWAESYAVIDLKLQNNFNVTRVDKYRPVSVWLCEAAGMQRCSSSRMIPFLNALMLLRIIFRVSAPVFDFKVFGSYFIWHVIKTEQILRDLGDGLAILAAITCDSVDEVKNFYSIAKVSFIFTHVDARKDQWSNQMFFYFLNGLSWWSNCCVLTPNNLTVLDRTGAWNLEVWFNHIFYQFAKDKNEQTLSYQKATRTPFQPFQLQTFSGVFARRQWSDSNDSSVTICELVKWWIHDDG